MFVYCRVVSNLVATLYFFGRVKCISQWRKREKKAHRIFRQQICSLPVQLLPNMVSIFRITHLCVVAKATPEELHVELNSYVLKFYSAKILL